MCTCRRSCRPPKAARTVTTSSTRRWSMRSWVENRAISNSQGVGEAPLGPLLDVVPDHMAVATRDNRWWWDVLENGPSSVYAGYFDVDWGTPETNHPHATAWYCCRHRGPLRPRDSRPAAFSWSTPRARSLSVIRTTGADSARSLDQLVAKAARRLPRGFARRAGGIESIGTALGRLPPSWATDRASVQERRRDKEVLRLALMVLCTRPQRSRQRSDAETRAVRAQPILSTPCYSARTTVSLFWRTASEEPECGSSST